MARRLRGVRGLHPGRGGSPGRVVRGRPARGDRPAAGRRRPPRGRDAAPPAGGDGVANPRHRALAKLLDDRAPLRAGALVALGDPRAPGSLRRRPRDSGLSGGLGPFDLGGHGRARQDRLRLAVRPLRRADRRVALLRDAARRGAAPDAHPVLFRSGVGRARVRVRDGGRDPAPLVGGELRLRAPLLRQGRRPAAPLPGSDHRPGRSAGGMDLRRHRQLRGGLPDLRRRLRRGGADRRRPPPRKRGTRRPRGGSRPERRPPGSRPLSRGRGRIPAGFPRSVA
jgi:hypothetical protein